MNIEQNTREKIFQGMYLNFAQNANIFLKMKVYTWPKIK